MRYWREISVGIILFSIYTVFWVWFFDTPTKKNIASNFKNFAYLASLKKDTSTLGAQATRDIAPSSYKISLDLRKQYFNLSCEFAAAAGIIFHFTNNPQFAVALEGEAEKILINKVKISKNPNIGIRMGQGGYTNRENLYTNLNYGFGGADYYGIHAPPFIDIFENYNLTAKPIYISNSTIYSIQKAISLNNLVMAWIKIGYGKPVDGYLSYGKVQIVRGEHAVIIDGYDETGVFVMDPGIGLERHIEYSSLIDASNFYSMPFLEVSRALSNKVISKDDLTIGLDRATGIDRRIPNVYVENGGGRVGAANQMRDILKDFGYNVIAVNNADNFDYQDISIKSTEEFIDFTHILNRDTKMAGYTVATISADLKNEEGKDIVVIVGK